MSAPNNNLNAELLNEDVIDSPVQTEGDIETPESKTASNYKAPGAPQRVANRRINHARLVIPTIAFPSMNVSSTEFNDENAMYTTPDAKIGGKSYVQK